MLRDGESVGTLPRAELTNEKLITLDDGQDHHRDALPAWRRPGRAGSWRFAGSRRKGNFEDVSFDLHAGEIVGITGLIGSGARSSPWRFSASARRTAGRSSWRDRPPRISSVQDAVKAGIAYVPENRLVQGLIMKQSVADNVIAAILARLLARLRLIDPRRRREKAAEWINALDIKVSDPGGPRADPLRRQPAARRHRQVARRRTRRSSSSTGRPSAST